MTHTQANEPGFVLANEAKPDPRIALLAKVMEAKRAELIGQPLSFIWNDLARVALDTAPIVPAPAYGVKEALEPFARAAGEWDGLSDRTYASDLSLTVGDLRRARAAYDALSSAPVEEADAKAGEPVDYEWEAEFAWNLQADDANRWDNLGGDEKESIKAVVAFGIGRGRSFASTIPSEPEAKGTCVPDDVRRLVIAAQNVALDDAPSAEVLKALDDASEAFAARVPWENEP